jgi:hypothetical protein
MRFRLTDKRRFNYIVLTLLAVIILIGIIQIMIEIKVLSI